FVARRFIDVGDDLVGGQFRVDGEVIFPDQALVGPCGAEYCSSEHVGSFGELDTQQAGGDGGREAQRKDENSSEHDDYLTTMQHRLRYYISGLMKYWRLYSAQASEGVKNWIPGGTADETVPHLACCSRVYESGWGRRFRLPCQFFNTSQRSDGVRVKPSP